MHCSVWCSRRYLPAHESWPGSSQLMLPGTARIGVHDGCRTSDAEFARCASSAELAWIKVGQGTRGTVQKAKALRLTPHGRYSGGLADKMRVARLPLEALPADVQDMGPQPARPKDGVPQDFGHLLHGSTDQPSTGTCRCTTSPAFARRGSVCSARDFGSIHSYPALLDHASTTRGEQRQFQTQAPVLRSKALLNNVLCLRQGSI